jgi:hypothetical protein
MSGLEVEVMPKLFCSASGRFWPITSISQFGPGPLLVEPDVAGRTVQRGRAHPQGPAPRIAMTVIDFTLESSSRFVPPAAGELGTHIL